MSDFEIQKTTSKSLYMCNNSIKLMKLLQMSFKLIKFEKVIANKEYVPVDGDIAQFLNMLDSQKNQGMPIEIVDKQVSEFAQSKGILKELVFTLMAKINEERVVVRNAERMVLGKKFKSNGF